MVAAASLGTTLVWGVTCPEALADGFGLTLVDANGNEITNGGEIDAEVLSQGFTIVSSDAASAPTLYNGMSFSDSSGSSAGTLTGSGTTDFHDDGTVTTYTGFKTSGIEADETYTLTISYRTDPMDPNSVVETYTFTFSATSKKGGGEEPSAGTGGGTGGGDGTGDGGGSGSGSGDGTGDGGSSSGSSSSGGWYDPSGWGGSSSTTVPSEGSSGSAGTAGTSSDPVIEAPVGTAGDDAGASQQPAGDASQTAPEGTHQIEESSQNSPQDSLQADSQETAAAAAAATKGGGGGDEGPTPKDEKQKPGEVDPAVQEPYEGEDDGTILAKLGEVYSLFNQPQKPVSLQVQQQPSFSVTGIPWLLAAMLAILLAAGPAGIASRFAGYRRGLSSSTRLGVAVPAAAGSSDGTSPEPPRERRDA